MSTYERATEEQVGMLADAMRRWHPKLADVGARVDLLVAFGPVDKDGEKTGPAIVHGGIPCLGICQITKIQQRVLGLGDAVITIDGDRWDDLDERERLALLDHELTHIELVLEMRSKLKVVSQSGETVPEVSAQPQLDDAGRPRMRLRKHDHEFGWFDAVAKRHGASSQEVQQRQRFEDEAGQFYMFEGRPGSSGVSTTISNGGRTVTIKAKDTQEIAAKLSRAGLGKKGEDK